MQLHPYPSILSVFYLIPTQLLKVVLKRYRNIRG